MLARGKCLSLELNSKKVVAVCASVGSAFHNEIPK